MWACGRNDVGAEAGRTIPGTGRPRRGTPPRAHRQIPPCMDPHKSEVYAYSIVLWELVTGGKPWHRDAEGKPYMEVNVMHLVVNRKKRPEVRSGVSSSSMRLIIPRALLP